MIRHYLKLVWNRKRSNLLITIEIFFSFLVVFAVVAMAAYYTNNYRRPLGFAWQDVIAALGEHPEWIDMNRHIAQKEH